MLFYLLKQWDYRLLLIHARYGLSLVLGGGEITLT